MIRAPGPPEGGQVFELIAALGSDASLLVGADRELLWASPNTAEVLGCGEPPEGWSGLALGRVLDDPRGGELVGAALSTREVQRGEIGHQGWRRILRVRSAPLRHPPGEPVVLLIVSDITHERRLGQAHQDLIANLSHDLRTPLASLTLLAETLNGAARDDPEATRVFAGRIADEAHRLHGLVAGILDLARLEAGADRAEIARVDLLELARRVAEGLQPQAERRQVRVAVSGERVLASADQERLSRALANVVDNAIKFSHRQGEVTVAIAAAAEGPELRVRDSGRGISQATMGRIFDRFYTGDRSRSAPGIGLGLTIAKEAVELQGGRIEVHSTPGEGTEVIIRLRLAEATAG